MHQLRVVHFCTVHHPQDMRVFHKSCVSLARAGYDVHLVVPGGVNSTCRGVHLHGFPPPKTRFHRMTTVAVRCFAIALRLKGDVYGIHSPELLPMAMLLRAFGKPVVYDVHEDFLTLIRQKPYLPWMWRYPLAHGVRCLERVAGHFLTITLAERYYRDFFPGRALVLNHPIDFQLASLPRRDGPNANVLLYTGFVVFDRGAGIHPKLVNVDENVEVHLVGRCSFAEAGRARALAGENQKRLVIQGEGAFVPHEVIQAYYQRSDLLAGLAIFPKTPDILQKELTKFFEYMAAGLPIVCSDFPVWRRLILDNGLGLVVDQDSPESWGNAIRWLREHPTERQLMGERGRSLVKEKFNWRTQEQVLRAVYSDIERALRAKKAKKAC